MSELRAMLIMMIMMIVMLDVLVVLVTVIRLSHQIKYYCLVEYKR